MITTEQKLKFLEEAVEVAGAEIVEEISAMKEGMYIDQGLDSILRTVRDLLNSVRNFEAFALETLLECGHGGYTTSIEFPDLDDSDYKFNIGNDVVVTNVGKGYSHYTEFCKMTGYPEASQYYMRSFVSNGDNATILARGKHLECETVSIYIVKVDDKMFAIQEEGLEKA